MTNVSLLWKDEKNPDLGPREIRELLIATCNVLEIALPDGDAAGMDDDEPVKRSLPKSNPSYEHLKRFRRLLRFPAGAGIRMTA